MTNPLPVDRLTRRDEQPAVATLAAAFASYPLLTALSPDPARRPRLAAALCRYVFRVSVRCGEVFATPDRSAVVCAWPPGREWPSLWASLRNGAGAVLCHLGWRAGWRLSRVERELDIARATHMTEPHWYVSMLGVRPEARGTGLSRVVLRPVFEAADRTGAPIYLETMAEVNVTIYQKLGFALRGYRELTGGLPNWELVREPRSNQSPVASIAAV